MQYLLTQEEYNTLNTKGNLVDHNQLMWLVSIICQVNSIPDSNKRLMVLESVTTQLDMFQQSGNKLYLNNIVEMFE